MADRKVINEVDELARKIDQVAKQSGEFLTLLGTISESQTQILEVQKAILEAVTGPPVAEGDLSAAVARVQGQATTLGTVADAVENLEK